MAKKRKKTPLKLQNMAADTSPALGSLGESCVNEGAVLGRQTKAGMTVRYESAACSCGGENANCFKCDGSGYYRREIVEKMKPQSLSTSPKLRNESATTPGAETHFSNDSRGGAHGIRESGRFSSNPLHDDYDN
jgi:hypothetical protein